MADISAEEIDRLEALERDATKGPWAYDERQKLIVDADGDVVSDAMDPRDDKFTAALRNAAPALIAAAKRDLAARPLSPSSNQGEKST